MAENSVIGASIISDMVIYIANLNNLKSYGQAATFILRWQL